MVLPQRRTGWGAVGRPLVVALAALIPLVALELGDAWRRQRRQEWNLRQEEERARQALETLAQSWSFADQMGRLGYEFREGASQGEDWAALAGRIFRPPFPRHELWVFRWPAGDGAGGRGAGGKAGGEAGGGPELVQGPARSRNGRRSMARIVDFLVGRARGRPRVRSHDELAGKLLRQVAGPCLDPEVIAASQRGRATPILHRHRPFWLLWDFVDSPNARAETVAWLVLVPGGPRTDRAALELACRDLEVRLPAVPGFLRLFPSPVGDVGPLFAARRRPPGAQPATVGNGGVSPLGGRAAAALGRWLRRLRQLRHLRRWERDGLPWMEPVGDWRFYAMPAVGARHLPFLLVKNRPPLGRPLSLHLALLVWPAVLLLTTARGLLLGRWPQVPLAGRFSALFLLAVILPWLLFAIAGIFYLQESRDTARHQLDLQLAAHLRQLDAGKERLDGEYLAAFRSLLRDPELAARLACAPRRAVAAPADSVSLRALGEDTFGDSALKAFIRQRFRGSIGQLPLAAVAVLDPGYGRCLEVAPDLDRDQILGALRVFLDALTRDLREQVRLTDPRFPLGPERDDPVVRMAQQGYESATGNSFAAEMAKERSHSFVFSIGRHQAVLLQDFILVDGRPRYALLVAYLDAAVDRLVLAQGRDQLCGRQPDLGLTAFSWEGGVLREALPWPGHYPAAWQEALAGVARAALRRGGQVAQVVPVGAVPASTAQAGWATIGFAPPDRLTVVAAPARKFSQVVLAAGADLGRIDRAVWTQAVWFLLFLLVSLAAALTLGQVTARHVVAPVQALHAALDRVAAGDLDQRLELTRSDELGRLAQSFTAMVAGLRERQALAGLLSAEAVAAIETSHDLAGGLAPRSFIGAVLVSDIRDFTTWCEREEPATVTRLLNRHFAAMTEVITAAGGRVHKFVGDAIQAVFPDDEPGPGTNAGRGAERAVRAGLGMLHQLDRLNAERQAAGEAPYRIGLGIAAGELMTGPVGAASRRDYALLGAPFAEAQALEPLSKEHPACPLVVSPAAVAQTGPYAARFKARPDGRGYVLATRDAVEPSGAASVVPKDEAHSRFAAAPSVSPSSGPLPWPEPPVGGSPSVPPAGGPAAPAAPAAAGVTASPAIGPRPGDGAPDRSPLRSWRRWLVYAVGAVWMSIPFLGGLAAWQTRLDLDRQARVARCQERHDEIIGRFRRAEAGLPLLEDHLETVIGRAVAQAFSGYRHPLLPAEETAGAALAPGGDRPVAREPGRPAAPLEAWQQVAAALRADLAGLGIEPWRVVMAECQPGSSPPPLAVAEGIADAAEEGFFRCFLHEAGAYYTDRPGVDQARLRSLLPIHLGLSMEVGHFFSERMGRLVLCRISGRPAWMFWQPLFCHHDGRVTGTSGEGAPQRLFGLLFLAIPRTDRLETDLDLRVRMHVEPDCELALLGQGEGGEVRSPGFPGWLARELSQHMPGWAPPGWLVTWEPDAANDPGRMSEARPEAPLSARPAVASRRLVVVSRVDEHLAAWHKHPGWWGTAVAAWLLVQVVWWRTAMAGGALARSLSGLLLTGMLSAGLLPLASALPLIERFHQEELDSLRRRTHLALQTALDDAERRVVLHRPLPWIWLSRVGRHPRLLRLARQAVRWRQARGIEDPTQASPALSQALRRIKERAGRLFPAIYPPEDPLRITVDSLRILTPRGEALGKGGEKTAVGGEESESMAAFARALGMIGKGILASLGQIADPAPTPGFQAGAMREEIGLTVGLEILRNIFGEDMYLQLLHRPGEPVNLIAGVGGITMLLEPMPDRRRPEFLFLSFYSFHTLELRRMRRLFAGPAVAARRPGLPPDLRLRFIGTEETTVGRLVAPERGGWIPDSRRLARWAAALRRPFAARVGSAGQEDLVEVRPGQINRNFLLLAAAPEQPLREVADRHRRDLQRLLALTVLITVLLALTAAGGLVDPVGALVEGMGRIEAGDHRFRLVVDRDDELGDLMRAFNRLARALEEREWMGTMVSKEARAALQTATAMRGERTLLMIGIPEFSARVAGLAPDALFAALTRQVEMVCGLCLAAGGDIDKVMGEKILVSFASPAATGAAGASVPASDRPGGAAVIEAFRGLVAVAATGRLPFPIVAGAARGPVIIGRLGAGAQYDFTVIGDPVNTAARLASLAEKEGPGTLLMPADLAVDLPPTVVAVPYGQVKVKGKQQALDLVKISAGGHRA